MSTYPEFVPEGELDDIPPVNEIDAAPVHVDFDWERPDAV